MRERILDLQRKIEALEYRVESFGDLGAERELEGLRLELRKAVTANFPLRLVA